jgi:hypothetical protein
MVGLLKQMVRMPIIELIIQKPQLVLLTRNITRNITAFTIFMILCIKQIEIYGSKLNIWILLTFRFN